jgi:DNA-binding NarL/FixJ family response regulator
VTARILLADDHALVRRGVRMILEEQHDLTVVAEVGDGLEAVEAAGAGADVALLDISMPGMTGLQVARELRRRHPHITVLLLSMHANEQYLCEALRAGASGYVLKSAVDRELVDACRSAVAGTGFVWPSVVDAAARERIQAATAGDRGDPDLLSPRELEVLRLIAEGASGREIAELLFLSEKTVDRHRANIFDKLGIRDRVEIARYAIRAGLIEA